MTEQKQQTSLPARLMMAVVAVMLLAALFSGVAFFNQYTQEQLYQESVGQLTEISNQLFEKLDVQLNIQWDYLKKLDDEQKTRDSLTKDEMTEFLRSHEEALSPIGQPLTFYAVDSRGLYYTDDGQKGMRTGALNLTDAQAQSYLTTDWITNDEFNLEEMLDQLEIAFRQQTNERHQNFTISAPKFAYPWVVGDNIRLLQILNNILSNAVKYTPKGGTIRMESEQGKGSTFEVELTLQIADAPTQSADERDGRAAQEENISLAGVKFLCAEDNALNAEILEELLHMEGATCTICENGQKVVEEFERAEPGQYDMILMDVQMPVMDGYTATRTIRNSQNPLGKTIPIFAMTANAFSEDIQHSLDAGMNGHISKPLDMGKLKAVIASFRAGRGKGKKSGQK